MSLKRVLIVDDAMELGRLYQESLRTLYPGVPVTFVPSAEEALLEASRFTFDLMISDIRLPGMSGVDLVRKIRVKQPGIKAVMITGLRIDETLQKQVDSVHAQKLLHKPLSVSEFLAAVQEVIGEDLPASSAGTSAHEPDQTKGRPVEPPSQVSIDPGKVKTAPLSRAAVDEPPSLPIRLEEKSAPELPLLGEELSNLRGSLGATAVMLLDDTGRLAASAGSWPQPDLAEALIPVLMSSLSASEKVGRQFEASAAIQGVIGSNFNLVFTAVGPYALLVFLKKEPSRVRIALAFDEVISAQAQITDVLVGMGINMHPGSPTLEPRPDLAVERPIEGSTGVLAEAAVVSADTPEDLKNLQELEAILGKPMEMSKTVDPDAFWKDLPSSSQGSFDNPDALSYDQARKLGLLPEE